MSHIWHLYHAIFIPSRISCNQVSSKTQLSACTSLPPSPLLQGLAEGCHHTVASHGSHLDAGAPLPAPPVPAHRCRLLCPQRPPWHLHIHLLLRPEPESKETHHSRVQSFFLVLVCVFVWHLRESSKPQFLLFCHKYFCCPSMLFQVDIVSLSIFLLVVCPLFAQSSLNGWLPP